MNFKVFLLVVFMIATSYAQEKYKDILLPAEVSQLGPWEIDKKLSDDFNYKGKSKKFFKKWKDTYTNNWTGPGLSHFSSNHSILNNGNLEIKAERKGPNKVYCGVVTSKEEVTYPAYLEIKMKINGLKLSSNFWFISKDQVLEIDVNETYGNEPKRGKEMGTNYHIFQRTPFKDLTPNNGKHYTAKGAPFLKNQYHRFGCHWKDAYNVDFYLDGVLMRELTIIDPRVPSVGFNKGLLMVIDTEDHDWRSNKGITPTDQELLDTTINTMYVDWVRVYKPKP